MDDVTIGRIISRREALGLLAAAGCGWFGLAPRARAAAGCVVRPAQTEGPYFRDVELERSDLRSDPADGHTSPGMPVMLELAVSRLAAGACAPIPSARVDLWHADHLGRYSGVKDAHADTTGLRFLRGHQFSDAAGVVRFTTIYPGWYPGRTVHFHFTVRAGGREFTSQLYFDDALTDEVFAAEPYGARGPRRVRNDDDGIFRRGGSELMLRLARDRGGYAGRFDLAFDGDR